MLNCEEATRLLSERQDRALSMAERTQLTLHTMMCSGCREFGRQMTTLRDLVRGHAPDASAGTPDDKK
jgi:predicted anti-sigma-YlaC factor YlaD